MNAAKTAKRPVDAAQAWAESMTDEIDLEGLRSSAEDAAHKATNWIADNSAEAAALASEAAHMAGDWLGHVAETATDWIEDQSARAVSVVPAVAAKRARRRWWLVGGAVGVIALVFFFYDPDKGPQRRSKLKRAFSTKKRQAAPDSSA
jgi:hypothetical protein